jgi:hypothetical protein
MNKIKQITILLSLGVVLASSGFLMTDSTTDYLKLNSTDPVFESDNLENGDLEQLPGGVRRWW